MVAVESARRYGGTPTTALRGTRGTRRARAARTARRRRSTTPSGTAWLRSCARAGRRAAGKSLGNVPSLALARPQRLHLGGDHFHVTATLGVRDELGDLFLVHAVAVGAIGEEEVECDFLFVGQRPYWIRRRLRET